MQADTFSYYFLTYGHMLIEYLYDNHDETYGIGLLGLKEIVVTHSHLIIAKQFYHSAVI